jgi:hypothetical protein
VLDLGFKGINATLEISLGRLHATNWHISAKQQVKDG